MKNFKIWLRIAAIFQLLTGVVHSMSFFVTPQPANAEEIQLYDLVHHYQINMGAGIFRSYEELFTSVSITFAALYLFGGLTNLLLVKYKISHLFIKNFLLLNTIIFGFVFVTMIVFAFLAPIILCGLVFVFLLLAYLIFLNQLHSSPV